MHGIFLPASTCTAGQSKKISGKLSSNPPNSPEPRKHCSLHQIPGKIWQHHPRPQRQAVAHRPMLLAVTLRWSLRVSNLAVPSRLRSKGLDQGVKASRLCSEVDLCQDLTCKLNSAFLVVSN